MGVDSVDGGRRDDDAEDNNDDERGENDGTEDKEVGWRPAVAQLVQDIIE